MKCCLYIDDWLAQGYKSIKFVYESSFTKNLQNFVCISWNIVLQGLCLGPGYQNWLGCKSLSSVYYILVFITLFNIAIPKSGSKTCFLSSNDKNFDKQSLSNSWYQFSGIQMPLFVVFITYELLSTKIDSKTPNSF